MCYSALEHLLCLAAQNSWESSRPSKWTIEQGTVLKNISRLINKAKKTLSNVTGSAKKRIEFMESYNYWEKASVIS